MKYLLFLASLTTAFMSAGEAAQSPAEIIAIDNEDLLKHVWQLPEDEHVSSFDGAKLLAMARIKALQSAHEKSFFGLVNLDKVVVPAIIDRYHEAFAITKHCEDRASYEALCWSFDAFIKEVKKSKRERFTTVCPESCSRAVRFAQIKGFVSNLPEDLQADLKNLNPLSHFTERSRRQACALFQRIKSDLKVD